MVFHTRKPKIDIILALTTFALLLFGLVMISSTSVVNSYETFGYNNFYLYRQIGFAVIGIIGLIVAQSLHYKWWGRAALPFFVIAVLLNIVVFIPGIGFSHGGATRWINLGFFLLQPSEVLKLAIIVFWASWFEKRRDSIVSLKEGFLPFIAILGGVGLLVLKQPDMGTFMVIALASVAMYFVAGARLLHVAYLFFGGVVAVGALIKAAPYRMARLLAFLNPEADPLGVGFHINQALIAVGSGGLWGRGFGKSGQKYTGYIPEAAGDSAFAIIAEELGFIKVLVLPIALFIVFAWRGFTIAKDTSDFFGKMLATGITSWIIFQAAINIATMLSLVPLTGMPLPFISYGGSSLIMSLVGVGVLLNISKHRNS